MKTPRFWQNNNTISAALSPLTLLYRAGAWADRKFTQPKRASLPVISVGNATAGGAGKTPTTLALIPVLHALGHTPHILTRGYKGAALTAHRVQPHDNWKTVGDEALLLARAAPTWVGRNRFASANAAVKNGATILICDDAHQHHTLHKDISLLVVDGPFGMGNGLCLPAGPLREPFASSLARADAVVMIGSDAHNLTTKISLPVFAASLAPKGADTLPKEKWLAFAGIARPEKFYDSLRSLGANLIVTRDFADHHAYTEADAEALLTQAQQLGAKLITTSKDTVKLPPALAAAAYVFNIALAFDHEPAIIEFLRNRLAGLPHTT